MTTATDTITYRKTKTGEWVAYGPADLISNAYSTGQPVTVTRRDGATKQEHIARCGRTFQVDGRDMIYGYLVPAARTAATADAPAKIRHATYRPDRCPHCAVSTPRGVRYQRHCRCTD